MAKMKLKNLLKMVNATKILITVKTDGKYKNYYVDYCSHEPIYDGDTHMACGATSLLPKEIMERTVTYIDAFQGRVDISCYEQ